MKDQLKFESKSEIAIRCATYTIERYKEGIQTVQNGKELLSLMGGRTCVYCCYFNNCYGCPVYISKNKKCTDQNTYKRIINLIKTHDKEYGLLCEIFPIHSIHNSSNFYKSAVDLINAINKRIKVHEKIIKKYSKMKNENYLMIDGNKISISKKTAEEMRKSFSKPKEETYNDVSKKLFIGRASYYISSMSEIGQHICSIDGDVGSNHAIDKEQVQSILDLNKLSNIAKYLNDGWIPDWEDEDQPKWTFRNNKGTITVICFHGRNYGVVCFQFKELAEQALNILREDVIRSSMTFNY